MYSPSHSNSRKEIPEELVSRDFDIVDNRFISLTPNFKSLGTYLNQSFMEDFDAQARNFPATQNFKVLGQTIFRNHKISYKIKS